MSSVFYGFFFTEFPYLGIVEINVVILFAVRLFAQVFVVVVFEAPE